MLAEVAAVFVRLGLVAFGGPAAHIALMEHELVRRRQWLSREEFLDLLGATNLIPGPNSTELAIHIGRSAAWCSPRSPSPQRVRDAPTSSGRSRGTARQ